MTGRALQHAARAGDAWPTIRRKRFRLFAVRVEVQDVATRLWDRLAAPRVMPAIIRISCRPPGRCTGASATRRGLIESRRAATFEAYGSSPRGTITHIPKECRKWLLSGHL